MHRPAVIVCPRRALLAAVVAACAACASAPLTGPYELWAVDAQGLPAPVERPLVWEQPGVRVELQPLTDEERGLWLARHAEVPTDPLSGTELGALVTFRMRISATGELPVHVETQGLRLLADGGGGGTAPIDYTRAYELLRPDQRDEVEQRDVEQFMRGLLDGAIDVRPGHAREGLLVFPNPADEARTLVLVLPFVQVGAETHRTSIPFQKVYESELAGLSGAARGS